ncbi:aldo/keto reductase [Emcibacter sp. SYSU 3D8]|uniref:aldo/keto reductase n=1 Tax=Emcibacter sp. SYSU 3D8 TaxID=3133969 RepID=UPI0031FE8293
MQTMHRRPIPSTGELLPVIGCGTWQAFDVRDGAPLVPVLEELFAAGGSLVDSSPMYGRAEAVAGALLGRMESLDRAFVATKVWTSGRDAGIAQMERSMALLGKTDLMQVHNLLDWRTHFETLRRWKDEGRVRYLGVTHYTPTAHDALEAAMRAEAMDFVQLDYALDDRAAERRLLPLAADKGIAVIVNRPFGGGGLARRVRGRAVPDFAAELGCDTWPQLLLKFILGHPAVTCAIPATANAVHMADNARAGCGPLPDEAMRARIAASFAS